MNCPSPDWLNTKSNTMKLEITKEKVLEAADKCPQAKETLKTLFPEVFKGAAAKVFRAGDRFRIKRHDGTVTETYILTQTYDKYSLHSLEGGNTWAGAFKFNDHQIGHEEMMELTNGKEYVSAKF